MCFICCYQQYGKICTNLNLKTEYKFKKIEYMKNKEEMIELGGGRIISKTDYQNALEEYYKTHKTDGVVPLTYDGKVIGRIYTPNGDIKRMTMEITTDEGKKIIDGIMHQPIGISSRKMGNVLYPLLWFS
jgi:hypothetical protein